MMRGAVVLVPFLAICLGGAAAAQTFHLDTTPLAIGTPFLVALDDGPGGAPYHVAIDVAPGPVATVELGLVHLGFTPSLTVLPLMFLDGGGEGGFASAVSDVPAWTGNVIYAQAVCANPAFASGFEASNPLARGLHPKAPAGGTTMVLALGDNTAAAVALPFPGGFPFYGVHHAEVYVGSNGLLTFGGLYLDPSEGVAGTLGNVPKVAVLWDDLVPTLQGTVSAEIGDTWARFAWTDVPQVYIGDHNSASATLFADGTISLEWPAVDLQDAVVAISPGGFAGGPTLTDFSAAAEGLNAGSGPVMQQFLIGLSPFDLEGERLSFLPGPGAGQYRWIR